jgi:predicted ATP-grasp superfamily ATP-dependent carboligase
MKIWFNKNFSSIAFILAALQKNSAVTTLFSHIQAVAHLHLADEFIYEPENAPDYLTFCLNTCQQYQVDVFYPWRHFALLYPHRDRFAELGVKVIFPCSDVVFNLLDNKALFYRHLAEKQIAVRMPLFATASSKEEFIAKYQLLRKSTDKLCMKPSVSIYAAGFKIIHDEPHYDAWKALIHGKDQYEIAYSQLLTLLPDDFFKEMMLLDFLAGDEYSHDILCDAGKIIAGTIRQKYAAHEKYQSLIAYPEIAQMSELLVAEFNLSGLINIQYRDDKNGVPFLLEINPRISGGFPKIVLAGIDYVDLFVKMVSGQAICAADIQQEVGVTVAKSSDYVKL